MLSALMPHTGIGASSGTIRRNPRSGIGFSLLLWCLACLLALLPVTHAISSYSTGNAAVLDAFEQDLRMSLFADEESDSIHMDMQVPEDLVPSFLSLDHSARFMASASNLDAAILGEIKKVTVSNQHDEKYKVCAAIDAIQKVKDNGFTMMGQGVTVSHADKDVVLFTITTKDGTVSDVYSYSRITGITHSSPLTQIILHVKKFHEKFVAEYVSPTIQPNQKLPTVREILFTGTIILKLAVDAKNKPVVQVYHDVTSGKAANSPVFQFPAELTVEQLKEVESYFNTVMSRRYGAGNSAFKSAGDKVRALVRLEHPVDSSAAGGPKFDIRVDKSYYRVTKDANKDEYTFYDVGLDEIHRCMEQGVHLIRAFCNPITGEVNTGAFEKSTLFATDYMRIPTGQTVLDAEYDATQLKLSTHVTTRTPDTSYTMQSTNIRMSRISSGKSPAFHALRTYAAFSWDPSAMAAYVARKWNKATDSSLVSKLLETFALPAVYDRMNGYSEALTSIALTLNPDKLVKDATAQVNSAGNVVSVDDFHKVLTEHILYPIGDNGPRENIRARVKRGAEEVAGLVCTEATCGVREKDVLYQIFIRGMCKQAFDLLKQFMETSASSATRLASTKDSFRGDDMTAGSVKTLSRRSSVASLVSPESDNESTTDNIMSDNPRARSPSPAPRDKNGGAPASSRSSSVAPSNRQLFPAPNAAATRRPALARAFSSVIAPQKAADAAAAAVLSDGHKGKSSMAIAATSAPTAPLIRPRTRSAHTNIMRDSDGDSEAESDSDVSSQQARKKPKNVDDRLEANPQNQPLLGTTSLVTPKAKADVAQKAKASIVGKSKR